MTTFRIKEGQLTCPCGCTHFVVRLSGWEDLTMICTKCGKPTDVQTYDYDNVWIDGPATFEAP
jgi:hypothetical protein